MCARARVRLAACLCSRLPGVLFNRLVTVQGQAVTQQIAVIGGKTNGNGHPSISLWSGAGHVQVMISPLSPFPQPVGGKLKEVSGRERLPMVSAILDL